MNCKKTIIALIIMTLSISSIVYAAEEASFGIGKSIAKLFFYIFVFVLVIIITNYGTRLIARSSKKFVSSKYIQVIDRMNLNASTKIEIIQINNKIYIIAFTNENIEIMDKIPIGKFELQENIDLENNLDRYFNNNNFGKIQNKLDSIFLKSNKSIDKEDENNEKNC